MKQLSDKNKRRGFTIPPSSNTGEESWEEVTPVELADKFQKIVFIIVAFILIFILVLIFIFSTKKEKGYLPEGGCYYFSQTDFKNNVKRKKGEYYFVIGDKEFTLYTQDIKVYNAYKDEYPDVQQICCTCLDTITVKIQK